MSWSEGQVIELEEVVVSAGGGYGTDRTDGDGGSGGGGGGSGAGNAEPTPHFSSRTYTFESTLGPNPGILSPPSPDSPVFIDTFDTFITNARTTLEGLHQANIYTVQMLMGHPAAQMMYAHLIGTLMARLGDTQDFLDQGHSLAASVAMAHGVDPNNPVMYQLGDPVDHNGQVIQPLALGNLDVFGDAKVSTGIDVTNGITVVDPVMEGIPNLIIPTFGGVDGFPDTHHFHHDYHFTNQAPSALTGIRGLEVIEQALIENPTPGNDAPATAAGTLNDVGKIPGFAFPDDWDDNFVLSFIVENDSANQTDFIVNYTVDDHHVLEEGFVVRYGELEDDGSINLITYGEGTAAEQSLLDFIADPIAEDIWRNNSIEIFSQAIDLF